MSDEQPNNGYEPQEEMSDTTNYEEVTVEEHEAEATAERTWTEEISMAGESVLGFIQMLYRESNVRRITVRNADGRVLLDIPVLVGAVAFYPPLLLYSALAFGAAIFANCSVRIERAEEAAEATLS